MKKGLAITFLVALGVGFLWFYFSRGGGERVNLEIGRMNDVSLGRPFVLDVSLSNEEDKVLKNARLSLILPDHVFFVGESEGQRVKEHFVGDVGPGSLTKETFNLIALGEEGGKREVKAKLVYSIAPNEKVSFEVQSASLLSVSRSALDLGVEAPEKVTSGEVFEFKVKLRNNNPEDLKNLSLKIDYPPVFQFLESDVKPDDGNNVWKVLVLERDDERELSIKGSVVTPQGTPFDINLAVKMVIFGEGYVIASRKVSVGVAEAPLSVAIVLSGAKDEVARLGDTLSYSLVYRNNSKFDLQNVKLKAKLTGEMFDFSMVRSDGLFDPTQRIFYWDASNLAGLARVGASVEGQAEIEVKVKDRFLIKRLSDKNYWLKVEAEVQTQDLPEGAEGRKFLSVDKFETKVAGLIEIQSKAYFRDAASGVLNAGNFPPKVGQATQYTLHWILKNYATDLENVKVSALLPAGVRFTGKVKSNSGQDPVFDQSSNQVIWTVPKIAATKGVISDPYEVIFQVEATPNSNQVGQTLDLLGETRVEARDVFAGVTLAASGGKLDTNLPDDLTVAGDQKTIQP